MDALKTASRRPVQKKAPSAVSRLVNPLILLIAGTCFFPFYGVIRHRGRRSGKSYRTPVVVAATEQGLVVPMPWGENTDWYRNVRTAGECIIRWKGRDYPVVEPEVIDAAFSTGRLRAPSASRDEANGNRPVLAAPPSEPERAELFHGLKQLLAALETQRNLIGLPQSAWSGAVSGLEAR
jgi:deazaflavin-dependent oxidoreductase (nitroreductase family)